MRLFTGILGLILLLGTLWDAFETIIFAASRHKAIIVSFACLSGLLDNLVKDKRPAALEKARDTHLSYFGPLSLLLLLPPGHRPWSLAFAILHWAAGSAISVSGGSQRSGPTMYMSGTTFFTLGLGDVLPDLDSCAGHYRRRGWRSVSAFSRS